MIIRANSEASLNGSVTDTISQSGISIAYFILVHRFPQQFKRLFNAVYHVENHYLIHLDKKTDAKTCAEVKDFLADFPNAYVMESENIVWGGYSMVQSEINGMKYLLGLTLKWDFFINLSGQDYPLKSQDIIRKFLSENRESNFIKIDDQLLVRPETMNRIINHFVEAENGFSEVTFKRKYMDGVIPYIGGQWMILTRGCCEFICTSSETQRFEDYYANTLIADESFFQTVLMNTSFDGEIVNDDKRAIIWIPDGDIKLRPKTFTRSDLDFLMQGENLFARKFDDGVDGNVIEDLKHHFDMPLSKHADVVKFADHTCN